MRSLHLKHNPKRKAGLLAAIVLCSAPGFLPAASLPALQIALTTTNRVGQYEKIEFTIEPPLPCDNPYDSSQLELNVEIVSSSGRKVVVPAFFYQPFDYRLIGRGGRPAEWIYPTGLPGWRARFAPNAPGVYAATAVLKNTGGVARSESLNFECLPRTAKGYVGVSTENPRYFSFPDGTPFFPIGQNLAFIGASQFADTARAAAVFQKMSQHGANFARIWACCEDWAMAIEARKSAWGRSWSWNPPLSPLPGGDGYHSGELCLRLGGSNASTHSVSPSHSVPLRPGADYLLTGRLLTDADAGLIVESQQGPLGELARSEKKGQWTEFKHRFTAGADQWWLGDLTLRTSGKGRVWLQHLSLQESNGGPNLLWETDPNRPPRGHYNQPDCFLLDRLLDAAAINCIYLQLCLFTRDHYRFALEHPESPQYHRAIADAQKLLRYAVARWGWSTQVAAWEYFNENDPNLPTERFHREVGHYLEQVDPYHHLRTTSGWGPAPKHWAHSQLDIADLHWYLRPVSQPPWKDEVAVILDRTALLRSHAAAKPAVLGEFGLADDQWGRSPHMAADKEGVHIHNALWASAFSGLSATASFWWWETLDQLDAYRHYKPLAAFLADVPFTSARLEPVTVPTERGEARVLALKGKGCAYCWISNPQATWWNLVVEKKAAQTISGARFELAGLTSGDYRIEWWNTAAGSMSEPHAVVSVAASLKVAVPAFSRDIACRIVPVSRSQ